MCTITWKMQNSGYEMYFNRDELRSRAHATDPVIKSKNGVSAIYPVDPEGLGSWIFCNDRGISAALLNYNIKLPDQNFKSRGTLITEICHENSIKQILNIIKSKNLNDYRGFTLCLFETQLDPLIYKWNGEQLLHLESIQPIVSSSVKIEEVKKNRMNLYHEMKDRQGDTREFHLNFHKSHIPEKSFLSTCMHREDAKSVSFSHINCDEKKIKFTYQGKPPCIKSDKITKTLSRNN